jgi:hypothetical protein
MCYTVVSMQVQVMALPKLFVIRGGQRDEPTRAPQRTSQSTPCSPSEEREPERSVKDTAVISLMDGWLRVLERQARSIKP